MSQIRIVKYTWNKSGTFEVRDNIGQPVWIEFQQMGKPYEDADHEEYIPIPIDQE